MEFLIKKNLKFAFLIKGNLDIRITVIRFSINLNITNSIIILWVNFMKSLTFFRYVNIFLELNLFRFYPLEFIAGWYGELWLFIWIIYQFHAVLHMSVFPYRFTCKKIVWLYMLQLEEIIKFNHLILLVDKSLQITFDFVINFFLPCFYILLIKAICISPFSLLWFALKIFQLLEYVIVALWDILWKNSE